MDVLLSRPAPPPASSPATFEEYFALSHDSMRVLAAAMVGRSDAADLVQEACIVAMSRFQSFAAGTNFNAWMGAIIRNLASNHRRGERRRWLRLRSIFARGDAFHAPPPTLVDADTSLLEQLDTLSDEQRACFLLKVVQDHSYAEIGAILAIPEATARSHVFRARKHLLERLTPNEGRNHD